MDKYLFWKYVNIKVDNIYKMWELIVRVFF